MKKFFAIFVAMLLIAVTCMSVVAADPESYVWAKWADAADNGNAPGFQLVLGEEDLSVLEAGKQYQVFANVYFSGDATGNVYFNFYGYEDAASAEAGNWDYLNSFQDFASSATAGDKLGTWASYESNLVNFGIDSYGKRNDGVDGTGTDVGCKGMTIGMGFWNATGEVRVSECGIKDADGNVVFSKKFDSVEGLKLMGGMADEANKGTSWGIVGEAVTEPTTPEVDPPATGDMTMVFALIALVSVAGATIVAKKRG